jgi:hypothetical protein
MSWLVFGAALVVGGVIVFRGLLGLNPAKAIKLLLYLFGLFALALLAFVALRGGFGYALAAASFFLPIFFRWRQLRQYLRNLKGPSPGINSDVETQHLRMSLDHDSGRLDGVVLQGERKGTRLSDLDSAEIFELFRVYQLKDPQSAALLEAYMDRNFGSDWRQEQGERARESGQTGSKMTRSEALEILGVVDGASRSDIKKAHRELMKRHHPDQGGSNYYASKLNQAKELLLKS